MAVEWYRNAADQGILSAKAQLEKLESIGSLEDLSSLSIKTNTATSGDKPEHHHAPSP